MPSDSVHEKQTWSDPRYLLALTFPLGGLIWAAETAFMLYLPYMAYFTDKGIGLGQLEKAGFLVISCAGFLAGSYYAIGIAQVFFLELRERFIARKVAYENGAFQLKGYYFKEAAFRADEVVTVEPVVVSERWFQKRLGTLLSRSTRFTIPHGKNVNLKITLRDGRVFYFPGEMGRPGQWKDEDVKELRDFMESLVVQNKRGVMP